MTTAQYAMRATVNVTRTAEVEPQPRRGRPVTEWSLVEITKGEATVYQGRNGEGINYDDESRAARDAARRSGNGRKFVAVPYTTAYYRV